MAYTLTRATKLAHTIFRRTYQRGGIPYMEHLTAVCDALEMFGEDLQGVGMLHSIMEFTDWTPETLLLEGLPDESIETLKVLTHDNSAQTLSMYFRRVRDNEDATLVKIACTAHKTRPDRLALMPPAWQTARLVSLGFAQRHLWTAAYEQDLTDILTVAHPELLRVAQQLRNDDRL